MIHFTHRRPLAALVVAMLVAAAALVAAPARATADFEIERIFGSDRYATAAAIALEAFPGGADAAIVATGEDFPDALAGSFAAGISPGFPVLLVQKNAVPAATDQALEQLGVEVVILLGGFSAITADVQTALAADYQVERIAGGDRFDTARKIAEMAGPADIGTVDNKSTAIIASGFGFADALAAGPISYAERLPILLTGPSGLATPSRTALESLGIDHVLILGGEVAITSAVENEIKAMNITTQRLQGADRFQTAAVIADFALAEFDFDDSHVNLAKGSDPNDSRQGFADALAGSPHAGEEQAVVLLTAPDQLSGPTRTWIEQHSQTLEDGHIFGGPTAVSSGVENAAVLAARNVPGEVVRDDPAANTYTYVPEGADEARIVEYKNDDRFFVDGNPATVGGFEAALDPGDRIQHVSGTPATHSVTNVADAQINNRTIGNVSTAGDEFDFISDVTGDAVRSEVKYASKTYRIGTSDATLAQFEDDLNEGDVVSISADGSTFTLQNRSVVGEANQIEASGNPVRFRIDVYGDDPAASSDSGESAGNDDKYEASGDVTFPPSDSTDVYTGEATTFDEFQDEITEGDIVTYTRVGGVETFGLDNEPLRTVTGTVVENNPNIEPIPPSEDDPPGNRNGDGGTLTLKLNDGSEAEYTYGPDGTFVIDGLVATEAEFEAQVTEGDKVVYTPKDEPASQQQRIELTNVSG